MTPDTQHSAQDPLLVEDFWPLGINIHGTSHDTHVRESAWCSPSPVSPPASWGFETVLSMPHEREKKWGQGGAEILPLSLPPSLFPSVANLECQINHPKSDQETRGGTE